MVTLLTDICSIHATNCKNMPQQQTGARTPGIVDSDVPTTSLQQTVANRDATVSLRPPKHAYQCRPFLLFSIVASDSSVVG